MVEKPNPCVCACGREKYRYSKTCIECRRSAGFVSVEKACQRCGAKFLVRRSHAPLRLHCSRACLIEAQKDKDWNMGRVKRKDNNHNEIADAFRALGWSVLDLSAVGHGIPDILIGQRGCGAHMVEVKNARTQYGKQGLSRQQQRFKNMWGGDVHIVKTPDEAVALSALLRSPDYRNPGRIHFASLSSAEDVAKMESEIEADQ